MQGRNTGVKAIFGSSVKQPLMTKVSMRHLNEIVRERNQYSRDAMEAWQDFINLKGRMDGELSKVTKRNNFLVDELESWKQQVRILYRPLSVVCSWYNQFLKFQAFAEQLTKETQDLKVKIETHKRENRRLTSLIEQQKDDAARLTQRLSGTEKQRDDALEALVLQQEIAEELERERKRNKKELSALQHTSGTILRQRDESRRVVLHLRSLIDGQTHHMEHIVRSLNETPALSNYIGEGYEDTAEELDDRESITSNEAGAHDLSLRNESRRSVSRASTYDGSKNEDEKVTPEMESRFFSPLGPNAQAGNRISITDVADRHLREKTDAIAYIIRNISDQCAAAVEGLQLAHNAETEDNDAELVSANNSSAHKHTQSDGDVSMHTDVSQLGQPNDECADHDSGHGESAGFLTPSNETGRSQSRTSSIPPTPDLVGGRSSTSMSGYSNSTATTGPGRDSQQWQMHSQREHDLGKGIKIVDGDEALHGSGADVSDVGEVLGKRQSEARPLTARLVPA